MSGSHKLLRRGWTIAGLALSMLVFAAAAAAATESRVTSGSRLTPFPQNKQNEPAIAIDASRPSVLAAGSNDELDLAPCGTTVFATAESPCPFTPGVGVSGVYFSFNNGADWVQPTYTGWSARDGAPKVGPTGTLPWYYENGLVSDGDPAVAFGPVPRNGVFSWANGSRLYYANLTSSFPAAPVRLRRDTAGAGRGRGAGAEPGAGRAGLCRAGAVKGIEAIAVSRADNVTAANYNDKNVWKAPVIASKVSSNTQFADKEQVWADNAETSPFFGNVYVCYGSFVGGGAEPLVVATSR